MNQGNQKIATFGAGCFWCVEAVFQDLKGVYKVVSGYMGGHIKNPAYREVCNGTTGHAEVIQIQFNPDVISYETLLEIFFTTHDPTTLNRQGADRGTQYRSAIFYHNENQKAVAEKVKSEFAPTLWPDPIVTEITAASAFYVAEDYHQNYYKENSTQPYCEIVINPKLQKLRAKYGALIK
ncbi:MAG: peptide-methionine (S)-S-oxide reductase MsrA [Saprospiraceae bacterium]